MMEERQVKTGIDRFLDLVNSGKELRIRDAAKKLEVPEATIELWADILSQDSLVEITYDSFGKMAVRPFAQKAAADAPPTKSGREKNTLAGSNSKLPEAPNPPNTEKAVISASVPKPLPSGRRGFKAILDLKNKNKKKNLLKKYSKIKRHEAMPKKDGFVSRLLKLFRHPSDNNAGLSRLGSKSGSTPKQHPEHKADNVELSGLQKKIAELKKLSK